MTTTRNSGAGKALGLAIALGLGGMGCMLLGFWMLMQPKQIEPGQPSLWPGLAFVLVGLAFDVAGATVLLLQAGKKS
jgi:hypothetical protein